MIEKPNITDEKIVVALNENYLIQAEHIEFLPIGNDSSAWAYRVDAENKSSYFLKIRKEISNHAGLFVPRFLKDNGIEQVTAPLSTKTQKLWASVDEFAFILCPFITGNEAMKVGMTDAQWIDFGERVFLMKDAGESTKKDSVEGFMKLFSHGDVVEAAFNTSIEI